MSNRTSCFSLENYNIGCCFAEAIEMKYKTHLSTIIVSSIVFIVLSPVAIVGNLLILVAIWKGRLERAWFHIFLGGLAFCDFCTGLLVQPFLGVGSLLFFVNPRASLDKKDLPMAIISAGLLSASFFRAAVLLLVTLLSIERWTHMRRRFLMTHSRRNVMVAVIVIVPVSITVLLTRGLQTTDKASLAFIGVFMLLCYLITFFAYFKVYRIIRQHQQQIHENQSQSFERSTINLAKYKRSVKSVLYIFIFFSLTFFPVFAVVAFMLTREYIPCLEAFAVYYIALVICFLSPSLNPALYVWRMNDIRNQVKNLFR